MKKEIKQKEENKYKKIPKEVSQEIMKQIFRNILIAIFIIVYFAILNIANSRMKLDRLVEDLKIFAVAFLITGIVLLERAYKKDSGKTAVVAIEWLVMSLHTLSIMHVIRMFEYNFMLWQMAGGWFVIIAAVATFVFKFAGKEDLMMLCSGAVCLMTFMYWIFFLYLRKKY